MKHTLFLLAPADNAAADAVTHSRLDEGVTRVDVDLSGVLPILPFVNDDRTLKANSSSLLLGLQTLRLPRSTPLNLFNLVADANSSARALGEVQALEEKLRPAHCFNRASDVLKTSRERLPSTLTDIPGCVVPQVVASDPGNFGELTEACEQFGHWPMIVRARGHHGGELMHLVKCADDLQSLRELSWVYEGIHLVQFIDFRGEDNLYQKSRVIVVQGKPYPRHSIFSDRWAIHAGSRTDVMDESEALRRREEAFLAYLTAEGLSQYSDVFDAIYRRIGLDIFGIDFGIVDNRIVVFEANACMHFLAQTREHSAYRYLDPYMKALRKAVKRLLMQT